jgi:protein involved in polysaccharide export with SLBB domain
MKRRFSLVLLGLWCSLAASAGWAQKAPLTPQNPVRKAPVAAKTQPSDYRLGPDDTLSVTILDHPNLGVPQIKVDAAGKIRLPIVGSLTVSGQTIGQVTRRITSILDKELNHPDVTVTLIQARARRVFVSGAVLKPGIYEIGPNWRVSEVIAAAGGLITRPELVSSTLSRGQKTALPLNLTAILRDSSIRDNVRVQSEDVLRVSEITLPVRIAGQVKMPGSYDVPIGTNVGEALALAGGLTPQAAARKVTVTRINGTVMPVDLNLGGSAEAQPLKSALKLRAGDFILVPESTDRVAILGAVAKPGYYNIDSGTTLRVSQALVLSGGVTARAALTRSTLVRASGGSQNLDLFGLLVMGDQTRNLSIEPGDIITIPESIGITVFGDVKNPATFPIEEGRSPRVLDVLTLAGGLNAPPSDVSLRITRKTAGDGLLPVASSPGVTNGTANFSSISFPNVSDPDVLSTRVYDGDLISFNALKLQTVTIVGEVKNPGPYEVKEGTGLVELVNKAGGPTELAALTRVTVRHKDENQEVDVRSAVTDGAAEPPVSLRAGAYVVVPKNLNRVYVMEAVNRPDFYTIPENGTLTVGEALTKAGGPRDRAKLWQVAIIRPQGPQTILNLRDTKVAQAALNTPLNAGDVLYVPEGKQSVSTLQKIGQSASLINIFRIFGF